MMEGWTPINSSVRKEEEEEEEEGGIVRRGRTPSSSSCMYVKVKMEGVGIGRKIDLTLYNSYSSLTTALIHMFSKCTYTIHYLLTYLSPSHIYIYIVYAWCRLQRE